MRKFITGLAIFVLIVGGGITVFWPNNFWRLFDANMNPLALTQAEAYCTGLLGPDSRFKTHNPKVTECEVESGWDNTAPDVARSIAWFCEGIIDAKLPMSLGECIDVVDTNLLWPIQGGGLTATWNDAHPRPSVPDQVIIDPARSGERPSTNRGDSVIPTP